MHGCRNEIFNDGVATAATRSRVQLVVRATRWPTQPAYVEGNETAERGNTSTVFKARLLGNEPTARQTGDARGIAEKCFHTERETRNEQGNGGPREGSNAFFTS